VARDHHREQCYGRAVRRAVVLVNALTATCLVATASAGGHARDIVERPIVLREGAFAAELTVEANLAHNFWAEPLSLAPDLWWGATDALTIGLVHSGHSVDRFVPGGSLCLRTDPLYCDSLYRGSGLDARYLAVERGSLSVAPRVRALVRDVEPFKPAVTVGALARWTHGRFAVSSDPYLQLGLANTEDGNRAALFVPVQLAVQPTCRWLVSLDTGWNSVLRGVRDDWHVPVGVGVLARATEHIDVGATLGFTSLLGPQNTPKQRVLYVSVGWRQ
jgi:hypothetical protein